MLELFTMKLAQNVTLYNAISTDGFIATKDGNSDWVSEVDVPLFEAQMAEKGCIVLGRTTFEQYLGELYPVPDITNIVMTSDSSKEKEDGKVIYTSKSPKAILELARSKGHDQVLLIGGGHANGAFLEAGLITEMILSVHPLVLGDGISLFEGVSRQLELSLQSVQKLDEGLVQLRYAVQ